MSIRIGNDFLPVPGLRTGSSKNINRSNATGSTNSSNANAVSSFANALSASMAATGTTSSVGMLNTLGALNSTGSLDSLGSSALYNNLSSVYSGLNYNVFDASGISQSLWGRNDFPLESFFGDSLNSSVLNWTPQGAEPSANSLQVMNRLNPTLGMKAIVIPPGLESKLNADSGLAQNVMDKISGFIKGTDEQYYGKNKSSTLVFDADGNISHNRTFVEGEGLKKPAVRENNEEYTGSKIRVFMPSRFNL